MSANGLQANEDELVMKAVNIMAELESDLSVHDAQIRNAYEKEFLESLKTPTNTDELDELLVSECTRWANMDTSQNKNIALRFITLSNLPHLFEKKVLWVPRIDEKCRVPWCEAYICNRKTSSFEFEECYHAFLTLVETWKTMDYKAYKSDDFGATTFVCAFDLLKNRNTHSCNINDLNSIKSMIKRVAKTDRFPVNNSVEGMQVIQSTWDKIDVFNNEARFNKSAAKAAYVMLLVLGAAVTIITVVSLNGQCRDNLLSDYYIFKADNTDKVVMFLTLTGKFSSRGVEPLPRQSRFSETTLNDSHGSTLTSPLGLLSVVLL